MERVTSAKSKRSLLSQKAAFPTVFSCFWKLYEVFLRLFIIITFLDSIANVLISTKKFIASWKTKEDYILFFGLSLNEILKAENY